MVWTVMDVFNTAGAARAWATQQDQHGDVADTVAHNVADLIEALGYVVQCEGTMEWNWAGSGRVGSWTCDRGFVIISIRRPSGEYIYGAAPTSSPRDAAAHPLLRTDERRYSPSNVELARAGDLRTIGNSLPPDIVNALETYPGADALPSWEFDPVGMVACPCAEELEDGAVSPAAAAAVGPVHEETPDDDSSSDEDE